jgi:hypothetical protein
MALRNPNSCRRADSRVALALLFWSRAMSAARFASIPYDLCSFAGSTRPCRRRLAY